MPKAKAPAAMQQADFGEAAAPTAEQPFQPGEWVWRRMAGLGKARPAHVVLCVEKCVYDWTAGTWNVWGIATPPTTFGRTDGLPRYLQAASTLTPACDLSCRGPSCTHPSPSPAPSETATPAAMPPSTDPVVSSETATAPAGTPVTEPAPGAAAWPTLVPVRDYYQAIVRPPDPGKFGVDCPDCKAQAGYACTSRGKPWNKVHKSREWARATRRDTIRKAWLLEMRSAWLDECHDLGVHPDTMNDALKDQHKWRYLASTRMEIGYARDRYCARYGVTTYRGKGRTTPPVPQVVLDDLASWRSPYQEINGI